MLKGLKRDILLKPKVKQYIETILYIKFLLFKGMGGNFMSEIKGEFLESNEAERSTSCLFSEHIGKLPCLKISYQLTETEIKADVRRNLKKLKPFFWIGLFGLMILIFGLVFAFIAFQRKATNLHFFCAIISGFFAGAFIGPVLLIFKHSRMLTKKLTGASEISVDLCFFKDCVLVATSSFMSLLEYSSKNNEFIENNEEFIVSYTKYPGAESFNFSVPKRYLDDDKIDKIREYAKKFEERYIVKTKI